MKWLMVMSGYNADPVMVHEALAIKLQAICAIAFSGCHDSRLIDMIQSRLMQFQDVNENKASQELKCTALVTV